MSIYHSNGKNHGAHTIGDDADSHHHDHEPSHIELRLHSEDFLEMFELNLPDIDMNKIEAATLDILEAVGEDPEREGLLRTPERVARAYEELLSGYRIDPVKLINDAIFNVEYDDMVIVRDIEFYSLCVPSKQLVNAVKGAKQAATVEVGESLWTLHEGRVVPTTVTNITSHQTPELVEIETEEGVIRVTLDHPFATPHGWMEAKDLEGNQIEWTHPKKLCRDRFIPTTGYYFGYAVGAMCSDGTVSNRYISLVVNDLDFARRFAQSLEQAFGVCANIEAVSRPSGFTGKDTPGFRVRVVSSYLADLFRHYVGGDAHHMRQQFPRVVLESQESMRGFIDGYVEGDGFRNKTSAGSTIISANVPFLAQFANVIGARFTPNNGPTASRLYIADSWERKHGFHREDHRTDLYESEWVTVKRVTTLEAVGYKPYTVYSFTCEPYPTFLIGGHLSHNCEHHMLPFIGRAHVAYISSGKVIGLSKIPRIVDMFARRLQVQERMTHQIAEFLNEVLQPRGVAVVLDGIHMCSMMRGVKKENASMTTSAMLGQFRLDEKTRAEFMTHITRSGSSGGFGP